MRVMQLTTDLRMGGAERVIVNLVRSLHSRGVECAVAGLFAGSRRPAPMRTMLKEAGFEVLSAGLERKYKLWRLAGLRRLVRAWRPDVLHCHLFHGHAAGAFLWLAGLRCPQVWTHHFMGRRPVPFRAAFYRLAGGVPGRHVFVSQAVRTFQRRSWGGAAQEAVVYNGIELAPFLALEPQPGAVFGALGRLVPEKNLDVLIRAFARLSCEMSDARLRIGGDGPERAALERLVEAEGLQDRTELVGFVADVPAFLSGLNVFAMPSRWESFGIALLEALAAGLPCVASRVGGMPEVGGDLVDWVSPDDADGLCQAMRRLCRFRQPADRVAAQRAAASRFSQEAMTEGYLRIYRALLGEASRAESPGGGYA